MFSGIPDVKSTHFFHIWVRFYDAVVTGIREWNLELITQISSLACFNCNKRVTPSWQVTHLQYLDEGMVPNNTAYQSTNASLAHNSCTYQHLSLQLWHTCWELQTFNDIFNHSMGCCFLGDPVTNFLPTLKYSYRYLRNNTPTDSTGISSEE